MKRIRSWGTVEKRKNGRWRARTSKEYGWKDIGHYDTKEQAEKAIEDFKNQRGIKVNERVDDVIGQDSKPFAEVSKDEVVISTGVVDKPITNWDNILISFGLDPDVFEVADDKVRMSKWQTSKRLESGERDVIWLYSYKAVFTHRKQPKLKDDDLEQIRSSIKKFKPSNSSKNKKSSASTFLILWADWQLAKSASGGVRATVSRVLESFDKCKQRIMELNKTGRNIEQIAFVNMGDPIEGCSDFYASQTFSVELNQRQQLLLALDLWVKGIETLAPMAAKSKFISTLSNHGEWTRRGSRAITTDSDSADAFLADALLRILKDKNYITEWHIPHDEMTTQVNLSGLECAFTHGHKISGKEVEWLRGQSLRLLRENGAEPRMWFTAHKHHFRAHDYGPFTMFQCPSLDTDGSPSGGSKWFSDIAAQWSSPGVLTMLVGDHDKRGFSDLAVL